MRGLYRRPLIAFPNILSRLETQKQFRGEKPGDGGLLFHPRDDTLDSLLLLLPLPPVSISSSVHEAWVVSDLSFKPLLRVADCSCGSRRNRETNAREISESPIFQFYFYFFIHYNFNFFFISKRQRAKSPETRPDARLREKRAKKKWKKCNSREEKK